MPLNPRDYLTAIDTLNGLQTRSQNNTAGVSEKLKEMTKYLNRCGISPERLDELPVIHVTGTHGKGSTCAYCESILHNHGYNTGFYSSPHLIEVRERIRINGKPISKIAFTSHFWKVYNMLDKQKEHENEMPLYFPFLTILAFYIFLEAKVDVAIIEVGIGGEYDRTNVIRRPIAVGITPICIDHPDQLGATRESIAWHKGGIMKEDSMAFSVEQHEDALNVLLDRSREKKCSLTVLKDNLTVDDTDPKIPPHVKRMNASLAVVLSEAFMKKRSNNNKIGQEFSLELAMRSIENAYWPGRYEIRQVKSVRFFLDGAHTIKSMRTTSTWFKKVTEKSDKKKALVFNLTGKRPPEAFFTELNVCDFGVAIFIPNVGYDKQTTDTIDFKLTTDTQLKRCEEYRQKWSEMVELSNKKCEITKVFPSFDQAANFLYSQNDEFDTLVSGSLYLVGAALSILDPTLNGTLSD